MEASTARMITEDDLGQVAKSDIATPGERDAASKELAASKKLVRRLDLELRGHR